MLNLTQEKNKLPQSKHKLVVVQGPRRLPVHFGRSWPWLWMFWCELLGSQWQEKKRKEKNVNHAADRSRNGAQQFCWADEEQTKRTQAHAWPRSWFHQLYNGSQCSKKTKWFCEVTQIMSIPPSWLMPAQQHSQHFIQIYSKNTPLGGKTNTVSLSSFTTPLFGMDTKIKTKRYFRLLCAFDTKPHNRQT